jgi:hypothetical protein
LRLSFQPILSLTKYSHKPCLLKHEFALGNPQQNQNMNVVSITISAVSSRHFLFIWREIIYKVYGKYMIDPLKRYYSSNNEKAIFISSPTSLFL